MTEVGEAHVLVSPFPAQGHVPPMLKLAEILSHAGLHVTFVNTDNIHRRFLASSPALQRLAGLPRFRFRTIPDGLPEDHPRPFLQFLDLEESLRTRSREHYRELLVPTGKDPDGWPPVTCAVADGILRLASEVAAEMEIPVIFVRTSGACAVWAYLCIPDLIKGGEIPFPEEEEKEEDGLDETIRGVPGMEGFLRRRDLPSFCRNAKSTSDRSLQFVTNANANVRRGRGLILNTFEALEGPVLSHIRSAIPISYALGPLHLLSRTFDDCGADAPLSSNSASLWQEDRSCLKWLDSQPQRSVVYISFGSVTMMSRDELMEFWHGLVDSGKRFLWVVRPDLAEGKIEEAIQEDLEKETKERGCLVGWAPQEEVLAHPAVACFLTHSGWNSTLESVAAGVPMICWPFFADQPVNSRFVGDVWRFGVDMKDKRGRSVVERMVREVMEGERAEELRRSAGEMAELARRSVGEGGSSYRDFENLVKDIKAMSREK
ncbi:myricetin 3-O-rhamnoside 1,2-glucosyltransferase UGT709G2-like isoform X2 [Phoenix dactylifera]|uniref:Glycosyltransferase n=1 Tax=Phoenix dactylifera TaxID=42345 RepID=A0A8B8J2L5_PHODC|nr:myricetin 3-O-rhamnoside 1,2-glucosyltransferase UGT709G2-like isoform X2 [Phoenix dactylifera]